MQFRSFRAHGVLQFGRHHSPDFPDISFIQQMCTVPGYFFFFSSSAKNRSLLEIVPDLMEFVFWVK